MRYSYISISRYLDLHISSSDVYFHYWLLFLFIFPPGKWTRIIIFSTNYISIYIYIYLSIWICRIITFSTNYLSIYECIYLSIWIYAFLRAMDQNHRFLLFVLIYMEKNNLIHVVLTSALQDFSYFKKNIELLFCFDHCWLPSPGVSVVFCFLDFFRLCRYSLYSSS